MQEKNESLANIEEFLLWISCPCPIGLERLAPFLSFSNLKKPLRPWLDRAWEHEINNNYASNFIPFIFGIGRGSGELGLIWFDRIGTKC